MRRLGLAIALFVLLLAAGPADASTKMLLAEVNLSTQELTVLYKGEEIARWPVSTGRAGYRTPAGSFRPQRMYVEYYSQQYDGAPMPHSIFYDAGYAIHGSYETGSLGRPASHGCVRLHPADAETLFELVLTVGPENTGIVVRR
jgi:lipoprotein-anchoring transpeptidase ErfK/SrfK